MKTFKQCREELSHTRDWGTPTLTAQLKKATPGQNEEQMKGEDPCWKGYEMVGHKNKNGKKVPNCVPVKEESNEGKALNKPFLTPDGPKKRSVYVKGPSGNTVKVNFGDKNLEIKRDDPERRKAYRARHNCDNPGPKHKANYWSCKFWSKTPVSKL